MAEARSIHSSFVSWNQLNELPPIGDLFGTSHSMQKVFRLIHSASHGDFPALIMGESGTGKELAAHAVHALGKRKHGPFVPVDCAALVPGLVESELFGHVKGAFTGADKSRIGLLQSAQGGTIFLD